MEIINFLALCSFSCYNEREESEDQHMEIWDLYDQDRKLTGETYV